MRMESQTYLDCPRNSKDLGKPGVLLRRAWMLVFTFCLCVQLLQAADADTPRPLSSSKSLRVIREYLDETDASKKAALLEEAKYTPADLRTLRKALVPRGYPKMKSGITNEIKLAMPEDVSKKSAEYSLKVPSNYKPNKLWPLIVGLHGGGGGTGSGRAFMGTMSGIEDAIIACPTSLDLDNNYYWRNPKNEVMLDLLVKEMCKQFPIDPNRVYLTGYSMGGIGVFYLGPRLCERYAAIAPGGGAWDSVYWPHLFNTPMYIWHGRNDMRGKKFTNYTYIKNAEIQLKKTEIPYEIRTMDCDHAGVPNSEVQKMCDWMLSKTRDPYPKRIKFASPCARDFMVPLAKSPANRWLLIDKHGTDKLDVMGSINYGGDSLREIKLKMGTLDATWTKQNQLDVKAVNVVKFRVFLSEKLVDFDDPIQINVNGKEVFNAVVSPMLPFAMQYIDQHRDIGMIYVAEISIDLSAQ